MKKALIIIGVILGVIFVPYLIGLVINHFISNPNRGIIDHVTTWIFGVLPIILGFIIWAMISGGDNDGSGGNNDSDSSTMLLITSMASTNIAMSTSF